MKADQIDWLLESEDPGLRRAVSVDLLDLPADGEQAAREWSAALEIGPVAKILSKQGAEGYWGRPEHFYQNSKYKGTIWNFILLGELWAMPEDARIKKACCFLCRWAQTPSGGFTYKGSPDGGTKPPVPCLTANMICSMNRLGFRNGQAVKRARDYISKIYTRDGDLGIYHKCPACRSGKVKVLKALSELPEGERTEAETKAAAILVERVLADCLPSGIHRMAPARPEWLQLGYPHMWDTDILEMLNVLASLGIWDDRMRPALDIVLSKQDDQGRWTMEKSFNGRFITPIERNGRPSRWVTYRVMSLLKNLPEPKQSL